MHRELQQSRSNPVVVIPREVERGERIEVGPLELRRGVLVAPFGMEPQLIVDGRLKKKCSPNQSRPSKAL
jgi:hypothetical protein